MRNLSILREADAHRALDLVATAATCDEPTPFPLDIVEQLKRLVGCDRAGYVEYEFGTRINIFEVESPWVDARHLRDAAGAAAWSWPLRDHSGTRVTATHSVSESLSRTQRHKNPFHIVFSMPLDVEDELKVWLPAPARQARFFWFCRNKHSCDFGERERALGRLLAPHLAAQRKRWEQRRRPEALTEREADVLCLVARGLTNSEIGAELFLSTGTVRKHLDHIYAKLGVHTRTAAAASIFRPKPPSS